jgi:uncharacterized protein YndB with AHSA1/START domain
MENISNQSAPPPDRLKKRFVIPLAFIVAIVALMVWAMIRGNRTVAQPSTPASLAEGIVTELLQTPEGGKQIHVAMIIAASPQGVWKVVTDYDHFSEIFPNVITSKGTLDPDGRWHLTGEVRSIAGSWPMDIHVRHEESAAKFVASWDEPYEKLKVDRGGWVVTPHGNGQTLLEYNLELKVSPYPDFVVRTILLDQLKPVVQAVANRARSDQSPR